MGEADALLFGRRTWQAMAGAWPERAGDPPPQAGGTPSGPDELHQEVRRDRDAGDSDLAWDNTTRVPGAEAVAHLHKLSEGEGGKLLVMGSPSLARTLLHEGLVDELRLIVMPVILGGGKSIFPEDGAKHTFELVSTATAPTGTQVSVYRRA